MTIEQKTDLENAGMNVSVLRDLAKDPHPRKYVMLDGLEMAYVEIGKR
jgi:hypothetical protein